MIEQLSNFWILLINSALFGFFTKLADLTDEHKIHFFRGDSFLFGILWGFFGAMVILGSPLLGSFYLAILFHWILRGKIDYFNHRLATLIILISFIWVFDGYVFDWFLFGSIFFVYSLFGLLRDNKKIKSNWFTNYNIYSYIVILIFVFSNTNYLIVLYSYILNTFFYQAVKRVQKNGKK